MKYLLVLLVVAQCAFAAPRLVIYQTNLAQITEEFPAIQEIDSLRFEGFPETIIPDTISVRDLEVIWWRFIPEISLPPVEQVSVAVALPETPKLVEKFIDKEVEIIWDSKIYRGRLLSTDGGFLLKTDEGFIFLTNSVEIKTKESLDLKTGKKPRVLVLKLQEPLTKETVTISYLARGFSWSASYLGIWNKEKNELKLTGVATISNSCGKSFADANVELIGGEVQLKSSGVFPQYNLVGLDAIGSPSAKAPAEVLPAGEYHRYKLQEPVDIPCGTIHVRYLPWSRVKAKTVYRFQEDEVEFLLKFKNTTGFPLPAGAFRVYGEDVFLGESQIGHTPKGEEVTLYLGTTFDLTGKKTQLFHRRLAEKHFQEGYQVTLRSAKDELVVVEVIEELPENCEVVSASLPYEMLDARHILFLVEVPPHEEVELEYVVEFWNHNF